MTTLKMILALVFCFGLVQMGFGQPDTLWTRAFGGSDYESGGDVCVTKDEGYIIIGFTDSYGAGKHDAWLIKTSSSGDTLWTKTYGGERYDYGTSVQPTSDGGYIITGSTDSYGQEYGAADLWLIKVDSSGNSEWQKTFGGNDGDYGTCVRQVSEGGYIIVGQTRGSGENDYDIWLIRTNESGDTLWTKTYGGEGYDFGTSVQQTSDGGYIITGSVVPDSVGSAIWLIKTNSSGDTLWTKTYGGESGSCVQQTSDEGYIIAGHTYLADSSGVHLNALLIKTNIMGDTVWTKMFRYDEYNTAFISVQENYFGEFIATGSKNSKPDYQYLNIFITKISDSGKTIWTQTYGGSDRTIGRSGKYTPDGGYIILGDRRGDIWLMKTDTDPTRVKKVETIALSQYLLSQNYPNPFNPSTTIEFTLPKSEFVELKVYNILGKEVSTLVSNKLNQGNHTYTFDGKNLASGIYYYQLVAGEYREVRKMILIK